MYYWFVYKKCPQPSLDSIFLMLLAYMSTKYTLGILSFQVTLFTRCNWALKFHVDACYKMLLVYTYILTGFGINGIYHQCQKPSVPTAKQQQKFFLHNFLKRLRNSMHDINESDSPVVTLCTVRPLQSLFDVSCKNHETIKESFAEIPQQYLW